jgi:hypothetical protein
LSTEHLTTAELCDYARGLRRDLHPHITVCAECSNLLALLRRVKDSAVSIDVPPAVVEEAKRIFAQPLPVSLPSRLREVVARLVLLHAGGEQLAAVRSTQSARQALYRYEDFIIDLRAEDNPHSVRTALAGQIANQRDPLSAVNAVPVTLLSGKQVLHQTISNEFGEFAFDFAGKRRLSLKFDLTPEDLSIEIPLRDIINED